MSAEYEAAYGPNGNRNVARNNIREEAENIIISKAYVKSSALLSLTITTPCCVILGLHWDEQCSYNLQAWIICAIVNQIIGFMIIFFRHTHAITDSLLKDYPLLKKIKNLNETFGFALLISGSVLFYGPSNCESASPSLHLLGLVLVSFWWSLTALPWFLLCCPCLWMPCFFLLMPFFLKENGANSEEINKLPIEKCTERHVSDNLSCPICIADFKLNESMKVLPCNHKFHVDCIDKWLAIKNNCPMCRQNINTGTAQTIDIDSNTGSSLV